MAKKTETDSTSVPVEDAGYTHTYTPSTPAAPQAAPEQVIYLGHTMSDGDFRISYATVFNNGLPADVQSRCDTDADFKALFVPVKDTAKTMRDLTKPETPIAAAKARSFQANLSRTTRG